MQSMRERSATVYSTSWCPHSRRARALLESQGFPFQEIDIERNASAARQVEAWNSGNRSVPTIVAHLILAEPPNADLERIFLRSRARLMGCTAYVTQWCPDCHRTLKWLQENRLPCTTIDIEADEAAAQKVQAWNGGNRTVPTLDVALRVVEPSNEQLLALLGFGE